MTWNMARKVTKKENEKRTLQDLEYGEKTNKRGKRDRHTLWTWNMARKLRNEENEKLTWQNMKYGGKH